VSTPEKRETLEARGLVKVYRGRPVVNEVDLDIEAGQVVGLLGPNGAGKTTTFYLILGLVAPNKGRVCLSGEDITNLPMYRRARRGIAYLPQEPSVFRRMSVRDNILAILEVVEPDRGERYAQVERLLRDFGLEAIADRPAYQLSGGERRRCEIARALAPRPRFMLLDEPFAGIDPIAVADLQLLIGDLRKRGIGVLITDHNVRETLQITDRAYIINAGGIFRKGTPGELVSDPEVRRVYLGEGFRLA
jgi:lipopolysaccharide export system ATP-binding protein